MAQKKLKRSIAEEEKSEFSFWDWIGMLIVFAGIPAVVIWFVVWIARRHSKSNQS